MFPSQLDSANYFTDGEQIACLKWDRYSSNTGGLCIFPQYLGKGKTIDGGAVTSAQSCQQAKQSRISAQLELIDRSLPKELN
jgi:hypothetical protein